MPFPELTHKEVDRWKSPKSFGMDAIKPKK
jgi:hypothetical protein